MAVRGIEGFARSFAGRDGTRVERPLPGGNAFDLTVVRSGPRTARPVVVIPGGPGLGSVVPYWRFRRFAAARGLDVMMVEHRGIGLSRRDRSGRDLLREDVTVTAAADDLAAALDAVGVDQAVVYGSSYGTYLAQVFGVRHPGRVAAMVLDSPLLSVHDDLRMVREHRRRTLWEGDLASVVQEAARHVPADELAHVVQVVVEFAGPDALARLLPARNRGRALTLWQAITRLGREELDGRGTPFVHEPDLVAGIAFGELGFGLPSDGSPLDPQTVVADVAASRPPFRGEPVDLVTEVRSFHWPTLVISGERDLRTPRPVAERLAELLPQGFLLPVADMGHSALDSHQKVAVLAAGAAVAGTLERLPGLAGRIAELPHRGASNWVGRAMRVAVTVNDVRELGRTQPQRYVSSDRMRRMFSDLAPLTPQERATWRKDIRDAYDDELDDPYERR